MRKVLISLAIIILMPNPVSAMPVFPGAEGWGTDTVAGSGRHLDPPDTTVYKVTNLNKDGSGSLKECINAAGPRVCVFEVSGTIDMGGSSLTIKNPYITIAGQTAPGPVLVKEGTLGVQTHDVLVQHITFRYGDAGTGRDTIAISSVNNFVYNLVFDHVSIGWGTDENVGIWPARNGYWVSNLTFSDSIISEGLMMSEPHSMGMLANFGVTRLSLIRNLFAHNMGRNPRLDNKEQLLPESEFLLINNVVYNWMYGATDCGDQGTHHVSAAGNVYLTGSDTRENRRPFVIRANTPQNSSIYLQDNMVDGLVPQDQYGSEILNDGAGIVYPGNSFVDINSYTVLGSGLVEEHVLDSAGAHPAGREDPVDARVVQSVRDRDGTIVYCVERSDSYCSVNAPGGWPDLPEKQRALTLPGDINGDDNGDGYTNLEEWLFQFSCEVEGLCGDTCTDGTTYGACSSSRPLYCDSGNLIDDCQACGCAAGHACDPDGSCSPVCTPQDSAGCHDNDVYWYDSCGNREGLKEDCGPLNCSGGSCTESPSRFSSVDQYLGDALNWEPLTPSRWSVVSDVGDFRYGINTTDYSSLPVSRLGEYSLVRDRVYGDFTFNATVKTTEDFSLNPSADYDVVFGFQDPDNYYYAMFNANTGLTQLFRVVNGTRETIATASGFVVPDTSYHIVGIERSGTSISVYFDGSQILEATDSTFSAGRIGIGGFNDASLWDDISVAMQSNRADEDKNGCISIQELLAFIGLWKQDSSAYPMAELMGAIGLWKLGTGCG